MSVTRIATRYAKSLMELAMEQGKLTQVSADIISLNEASRNRDLYLMLKSPIINGDKKIAVMDAIFKGKFDDLTMAYIKLLINKGREAYIPEISAEFATQYKTLQKITSVTVITAAEMSDAVLADLKKKLLESEVTSDNLEILTKVNPNLIGGFVLEFDNKRYDASISHKLEELRSAFSKNLYIKEF
ncbi:MAG: ATP synthase F1 subunit delta [Saprospiraceae bacterium]|jgi:F-type H+-transporting ATPase subunit delta|nr:ATP synthase F1 subunit delta [Saprospiraceae bacterium]